ncbi:universal stress protein [Phreatobacter stygius]|nr:universal stress protein [Phreatobacter stygius]
MKDIVVHLDGGAEDETRLSYAEQLATGRGAHITGLYTNVMPDIAMMATPEAAAAATVFTELEQAAKAQGDATAARLLERLTRSGLPVELARCDQRLGELSLAATSAARCADLFIATCPYRGGDGTNWDGLAEAVLSDSGRGTLFVPPGLAAGQPAQRIMIAWRDTHDAARAVAEALPLMAAAARVDLVMVDADPGETGAPAADMARHLARHGAKVDVRAVASDGRSVAQALTDEAGRGAIDLLVMGGYGHSRLREWVLGGTTRDILTTTAIPVLMAH